MSTMAKARLTEERKAWKSSHPVGFWAKPLKAADGSVNLLEWECGIPGRAGTPWEGGTYKLLMTFPQDYPAEPPVCRFNPPLFHPNVFPSGKVCLSILNQEKDWVPTITIKDVLLGIQDLLNNPNLLDPAQREAHVMCKENLTVYLQKVRSLAKLYAT